MINILSPDVYNRIAAGEVVDRPYSVVKELVENSIDAGATEIRIEIEGGGKQKIRISDNGCGISEDLPRAYHPHATSKLLDAEDLFTVSTLGFRGEAIASIASVSKMNIVSDAGAGAHSLACEGGVLGKVLPSAGARGTEITVCDLFYNTPARLKFLKSDSQEETDVTNMIARFILSRPEISFTYTANGKLKYRSLGEGLPSAIAVVYGASTLDHCLEISADKHGILLHGFIGDRNFSKPNRTYQSLFVNGRYVVNQTVGSAVTNAYAAYLMKRQYPFYVLFLDLPKEIVDVNVHPNKADVRFQDNQIIYGSVYSVLSSVLDGNSRAVEYLVGYQESGGEERTAEKPLPAMPAAPVSDKTMTYEEAKKELQFDISPLKNGPSEPRFYTPDPVEYAVHAPTSSATVETQEDVFAENQRFLREEEHSAKQAKVDVKNLTFKGELFRTYLIYEAGDEAYIVDQHAAHERLNYDRLQAKLAARTVISQPMLVPYLLEVNPAEFAFLTKNFPILREMGFEIEEFGSGCVKVSAVPSDLVNINLSAFFGEVLTSMESLRAIKLSELLKDRLASAACKAAVKGGEYLTDEEAKKLLERMDGDMGLKCPHGRPVAVKVKRSELEKLFKRIV